MVENGQVTRDIKYAIKCSFISAPYKHFKKFKIRKIFSGNDIQYGTTKQGLLSVLLPANDHVESKKPVVSEIYGRPDWRFVKRGRRGHNDQRYPSRKPAKCPKCQKWISQARSMNKHLEKCRMNI